MKISNEDQLNYQIDSDFLSADFGEFEFSPTLQEIKNKINTRQKNKQNNSKIIKYILWERTLRMIIFLFYFLIFLSCIIVTIIFRDTIMEIITKFFI